jgi:hypothetical protein
MSEGNADPMSLEDAIVGELGFVSTMDVTAPASVADDVVDEEDDVLNCKSEVVPPANVVRSEVASVWPVGEAIVVSDEADSDHTDETSMAGVVFSLHFCSLADGPVVIAVEAGFVVTLDEAGSVHTDDVIPSAGGLDVASELTSCWLAELEISSNEVVASGSREGDSVGEYVGDIVGDTMVSRSSISVSSRAICEDSPSDVVEEPVDSWTSC